MNRCFLFRVCTSLFLGPSLLASPWNPDNVVSDINRNQLWWILANLGIMKDNIAENGLILGSTRILKHMGFAVLVPNPIHEQNYRFFIRSVFHVCHNEWKTQTEAQHYLYTSCKLPVRCGFHSAFVDHSAGKPWSTGLSSRATAKKTCGIQSMWKPGHDGFGYVKGDPPYFSSIGPKDFQRIFFHEKTPFHFHRGSYMYGNLQPLGKLLLMWKNIWFSIRKT